MTPVQGVAGAVGAVFVLVGLLGFVPGITSDLGDIEFVGHDSEAELLGIFQVNVVHNIVHLAFGAVGLVAMRTAYLARAFLVVGGVVYFVLWLYGVAIDLDSDANFAAFNSADNWLHFSLGAGMVLLGAVVPGGRRR